MNLEDAISIAAQAHKGQTRWDGSPYILHPLRVMMSSWMYLWKSPVDAQIVAVLHDVVEDTDVTVRELESQGLAPELGEALQYLTHVKGDYYMNYIEDIARNPLATLVKLADLEDNMKGDEVPDDRKEKHVSMMDRYKKAKARLLEAQLS